MLPAECSRRLVAELRDALDSCAERQRQLEQSLRVSRRLLRAWEPAETPAPEPTPGPEINEETPSSACPPSPQDLKELELLTQALEKAVRVRKGLSKAGGVKARSPKSGSASSATRASAPPSTSRCAGSCALEAKPPRGVRHPWVPAKDLPGHRLLLVGDGPHMGQGARANKPEAGLRDQQIVPKAASQVPEAFTLKDKGALLRLPEAFRKAASRNARVPSVSWAPPLGLAYFPGPWPAGWHHHTLLSGLRAAHVCIQPVGPAQLDADRGFCGCCCRHRQNPVPPENADSCRPTQLHAQCSRGEAPAESLLAAEASNEGGAHGRPQGLDAGVPQPAHPGGAAGPRGAVSAQAAGAAGAALGGGGTAAGAMS
ncbi:tubulin epsilon and delta complex protein 2 isoform X2 [Moschus berezovskii]|uniref:tubulin epsilon and delta complex protein 2 isoform X2 n=1 Tax=Moschus berezovskii TaxID=68408 RepID=UPI0024446B03|nr:tubulin epsilon and delta complex protein 2 isoform X2 [Moschus berezovskii]